MTYMTERPAQVTKHVASTSKAFELLGWKAEVTFEDGIARTIKWYQQNPEWWQKLLWMRHVAMKTKDGKIELY